MNTLRTAILFATECNSSARRVIVLLHGFNAKGTDWRFNEVHIFECDAY